MLGARQGAIGGVTVEAIRYPFDQLETPQEAIFNIGASTALGGALGVGIPAAFRLYSRTFNGRGQQMAPEFERAERTIDRYQRGGIVVTILMAFLLEQQKWKILKFHQFKLKMMKLFLMKIVL